MVVPILLSIVGVVAVVLLGLVVVAMMQPNQLVVSRSVTISAPADQIFPHINNLKKWDDWSPWDKKDPDMQKTYEGAEAGEGASYSWDGNKDVGAGKMTISKSEPARQVDFKLEFSRPWESECDVEFALLPQDNGTEVSWTMRSDSPFMAKLMGLFMNMDAMIGKDFESGLSALKDTVEAEAAN